MFYIVSSVLGSVGDTGTKKAVDNAGFTGDLYLLDKDDQMMVSQIDFQNICQLQINITN